MREKKKCVICETKDPMLNYVVTKEGKYVCTDCIKSMSMITSVSSNMTLECGTPTLNDSKNEETYFMLEGKKPKQIKQELDQYVIGQEDTKISLSVAAYNHYKRVKMKDDGIKKSNVLMIGPTGCGKTHIIKSLAKIIDVPVAIVSATGLTAAGYVGKDVESIITSLVREAGQDIMKAELGIIFIDEVDKLAATKDGNGKDIGGESVQQALLTMLEGDKVAVKPNGENSAEIVVDTSNILFICGGAFPNMEGIIKERLQVEGEDLSQYTNDHMLIKKVTDGDVTKFGMIPEFIGRLPILTTLDSLTEEMYMDILTKPKDNLLSQYQKLFAFDGINLIIEDDALREIARRAIKRNRGARSLRTEFESALKDLMFKAPSYADNIESITITKETLTTSGKYIIKQKAVR